MAGRCIPSVVGGDVFMGDEVITNMENKVVTGELLAKASRFLAKFSQAQEVIKAIDILMNF